MATDHTRLRAVLNTNVIVAALITQNAASPTAELLRRWERGEFDLLYTQELRAEYEEKLASRRVDIQRAADFLTRVGQLGILIAVLAVQVLSVIAQDPDDDLPLACAVIGKATHLVSYDQHYAFLRGEYRGVRIVDGLRFLYLVRGDELPATFNA